MKKNVVIIIVALLILAGTFKCPLYSFVGVPCPTCGMTRAWRLFLTGNIQEAFKMHPLFLLPLLFLIPQCRRKWAAVGIVIILVTVYIIRMFFLFPSEVPMNFNFDSMIGEFLR